MSSFKTWDGDGKEEREVGDERLEEEKMGQRRVEDWRVEEPMAVEEEEVVVEEEVEGDLGLKRLYA